MSHCILHAHYRLVCNQVVCLAQLTSTAAQVAIVALGDEVTHILAIGSRAAEGRRHTGIRECCPNALWGGGGTTHRQAADIGLHVGHAVSAALAGGGLQGANALHGVTTSSARSEVAVHAIVKFAEGICIWGIILPALACRHLGGGCHTLHGPAKGHTLTGAPVQAAGEGGATIGGSDNTGVHQGGGAGTQATADATSSLAHVAIQAVADAQGHAATH